MKAGQAGLEKKRMRFRLTSFMFLEARQRRIRRVQPCCGSNLSSGIFSNGSN